MRRASKRAGDRVNERASERTLACFLSMHLLAAVFVCKFVRLLDASFDSPRHRITCARARARLCVLARMTTRCCSNVTQRARAHARARLHSKYRNMPTLILLHRRHFFSQHTRHQMNSSHREQANNSQMPFAYFELAKLEFVSLTILQHA